MARHITVGIDIGTYQVKVVVTEAVKENDRLIPKIIGTGCAESKGLRHGYIINSSDCVRSIATAVAQAEKTSGVKIKRAFVSVGGIGLSAITSLGSLMITRADSVITDLDVKKVLEVAEAEVPPRELLNRRVIHSIPLSFKIDGKPILGSHPQGLKGGKLEAKVLFVTCLEHHLSDIIEAIGDAGISVLDVMASPLAAGLVTLSKTQKIAGCILTNIGSETASIVVYENNIPISLEVFPIGSSDITNDIALGLRVPLEEAEDIKRGSITATSFPKKKLEEIVIARLSDIFELIEAHLKKIGKNGLLPAGIIITGGGSGIATIEDLAKAALKLPSKIALINSIGTTKETFKDSTWSVAYGLCFLGLSPDNESSIGIKPPRKPRPDFLAWIKQFLP